MENSVKNRALISGGIAVVITALFFFGVLKIPEAKAFVSSVGNLNIVVYAVTLVLFAVSFLICMGIMTRFRLGTCSFLETSGVKQGTLFGALAVMAVMAIVIVQLETKLAAGVAYKYAWHTQPMILAVLFFVLEMLVFLWMYIKWDLRGKEISWFVWGVYALLFVLVLYAMDTPNIYGRGDWGDWYHAHAYFNSIYNVHWGVPFTGEITSIYGHYALLWKLPMKLIGGDFRKFVFLMAVVGAFAHGCALLTLKQTVKSRLLQLLGALAIVFPALGMRGGYYWQLWPHRILFSAIMMLYAVWVLRKQKVNWITTVIGYIICVFAVIWNTETGVVLAIAWGATLISHLLSQTSVSVMKFIGQAAVQIVGIAGSFFGAYGIVNLYNILKGSPVNTIPEFLLPLMSDHYMTDILHLDLPLFPSAYMAEILLFFMGVAVGICEWRWFRKADQAPSWSNQFIFFMSISALGRFVYFMNRPAYHNMDCCHFSAVIVLAFFAEKALRFIKNQGWKKLEQVSFHRVLKHSISVVCLMVILAMGTGTVLQFGANSYIKSDFHDTEEFDEFIQTIAENVPPNTFGFGMNVAEVYSSLHWSTQYYSIDFSDLAVAPQGIDRLIDTLEEQYPEFVFVTQRSIDILGLHSEEAHARFWELYHVANKFPMSTETFYLMTRRG